MEAARRERAVLLRSLIDHRVYFALFMIGRDLYEFGILKKDSTTEHTEFFKPVVHALEPVCKTQIIANKQKMN